MVAPNMSELATMTIEHRTRKLADNITDNCALLMRIKSKGNMNLVDGGTEIAEELEYDENDTFQWMAGYEIVDLRPQEVFSAATFNWKECMGTVSISEREKGINSGTPRMINLLKKRIRNLEKTFKNRMSASLYADGTGNGGKELVGLKAMLPAANNAGVYGNINRATWPFWRHRVDSGLTAANIFDKFRLMYLGLKRNDEHVDFIVTNDTIYNWYWDAMQKGQRFTGTEVGKMGFNMLKLLDADVFTDGGVGGPLSASDQVAYFINTDYVRYSPHKDKNIIKLKDVDSPNQAATVKRVYWMGAMTCSNQMMHGRLSA